MRRLLAGVLTGILLLPPLLLFALVATETGTRAVVGAGSRLVPGLSVAEVQGTLLGELRLGEIGYRDAGQLQLQLAALRIRWQPLGLLDGRLQVHDVHARGLSLQLPAAAPGPETPEPFSLPERITLPLVLQLDRLLLEQALLRQGQQQWQLERLELAGQIDRAALRIDALQFAGEGVQLSASGRAAVAYPFPFSLTLDWQAALPEPPGLAAQGELALAGELSGYELTLAAVIHPPDFAGPLDVEISAQGDLDGLQIGQGRLQALGGESRFTGKLGWKPALAWELAVQATGIDPGRQWPEWPGSLALQAATHGSLAEDRLQVELDVQRLHGSLREHAVDGRGQFALLDGELELRGVMLQSGDNRLQLNGQFQPALAMSYAIDASDLNQVAPMLAGSLQGQGDIRGSLADPAVSMNLHGSRLKFAELRAGELALVADIDPAQAQRSRFSLQGKALEVGGTVLDSLALDGTGNIARHRFTASAAGPDIGLQATAAGGYDGQQWRGELSRLDLDNNLLGHWQLEQPVSLQAGNTQLNLDTLCLLRDAARVCASGQRAADGSLRAAGELAGLPVAWLTTGLPENTGIDGVVSGRFGLAGQPEQLQAEAALQVSAGELRYHPEEGPDLVVSHRNGHATLDFRDDMLAAEAGIDIGDDGRLDARGRLGADTAGQRTLQATLDFALPDPRVLEALALQLADWSGPMEMHAELDGTLQQPALRLDGGWRDGRVSVPELGITLSDIQLDLQGDGERITLQGHAASGEGRVSLAGEAVLDSAAGWPVRLDVEGENFSVAQRADLEVAVSPQLQVAMAGQATSVTGQLAVPKALIVVADIPRGVVRVSPDEVIVDSQSGDAGDDRAQSGDISAALKLILGEDVRLKAYGLDTRLTGQLDLYQKPGVPAEAVGQVHLEQGVYKGYGQDLSIERGRLLFSGPFAAAELDVRAVRKIKDVTAGILLTGPLVKPRAELFSEPPMEEAETLSYLITGRPLSGDGAGGGSAAQLAQAALGLGLDKTGTFGLDELSIEAGESGKEDSAMTIGKQLTPDMYVRYIYGLFDSTATLQLRYTLSKHLRVEVGTGQQQSADVLYELERD